MVHEINAGVVGLFEQKFGLFDRFWGFVCKQEGKETFDEYSFVKMLRLSKKIYLIYGCLTN